MPPTRGWKKSPPDKGGQGGWFPAEGGRAGRVKYYSLRLPPILPCHEPPNPPCQGGFFNNPDEGVFAVCRPRRGSVFLLLGNPTARRVKARITPPLRGSGFFLSLVAPNPLSSIVIAPQGESNSATRRHKAEPTPPRPNPPSALPSPSSASSGTRPGRAARRWRRPC